MSNPNPTSVLNNQDNHPSDVTKEVDNMQYLFGVNVFRTAKQRQAAFCAKELTHLFECMGGVDPGLIVLPYDCNKAKAQ